MKASEYTQAPFFPPELFAIIKAAKAWARALHLKPSCFGAGGITKHEEGYTVSQAVTYIEFSKMYTSEFDKTKLSYPHEYPFSSTELQTTFRNWLEMADLDTDMYKDPELLINNEKLSHVEYCTVQWYIQFYNDVVYLEQNPPAIIDEESSDEDLDNFMQMLDTKKI